MDEAMLVNMWSRYRCIGTSWLKMTMTSSVGENTGYISVLPFWWIWWMWI